MIENAERETKIRRTSGPLVVVDPSSSWKTSPPAELGVCGLGVLLLTGRMMTTVTTTTTRVRCASSTTTTTTGRRSNAAKVRERRRERRRRRRRVRWDGWVTDDGSAVHPSSVQLSIGDRGVEPPDPARAWGGWNGADVGPVVDPDAKDERRARSNGGGAGCADTRTGGHQRAAHPSRRAGCFICLSTDDGPSGRHRPRRRADERNARVN